MAVRIVDGECERPLIHDITGITSEIRRALAESGECGPLLHIIDEHCEEDGREGMNVEEMLTHIRGLRVIAGNAEVRRLTAAQLDVLDLRICELIHQAVHQELPDDATPYHRVASWIGTVERNNPVELFTTNYDLLMEQALEELRVPYFDGFLGGRRPFLDLRAIEEDRLPARWTRLWKLHGSINWYQAHETGVFRGTVTEPGNAQRVIHPSHLKYEESRRMPYLAMVDRLRAFLKQPSATLVLSGYSFRDEHINEVIVQGLQGTPSAIAFVLLHGDVSKYENAIALARRRPNLTLLARNGGVVSARECSWVVRASESQAASLQKGIHVPSLGPPCSEGEIVTEFTLGDFAEFGSFTHELVGATRHFDGELLAG